jgi:sulfoxide reductase heme-binding subunit YedZ
MSGLLAATSGRELWYLTRSSGIVVLLLLTGVMLLGVASAGNWERPNWPRFLTQGLHRNLSLLAVLFLFVHVLTTVVDGYVPIGWLNAVVPFTSPYHRFWLGLGAVGCDFMLALVLTSLLRRHLRPATWRGLHWLAYACWPVALLHGLGTGTDASTVLMRWVAGGAVVLVVAAVLWRLSRNLPRTVFVRTAGATAVAVAVASSAFAFDGGLREGTVHFFTTAPLGPSPAAAAPAPPSTTSPPPSTTAVAPGTARPQTPATTSPPALRVVDDTPAPASTTPSTTEPPSDDGPSPTTTRPPPTTTTPSPPTTTTPPPPPTTPPPPPTTTTTAPYRCRYGCDDGGTSSGGGILSDD